MPSLPVRPLRSLGVLSSIGPFFSNGGLKNWHFKLCRDEIVAVPLGVWLSLKAGLLAGLGWSPDAAYRSAAHADPEQLVDEGKSTWRRYPLDAVDYLLVKRCATANEILIKRLDAPPQTYGIGHRPYTDLCRMVLAQTYGAKYREEGF
jgi:hypothetical protein